MYVFNNIKFCVFLIYNYEMVFLVKILEMFFGIGKVFVNEFFEN